MIIQLAFEVSTEYLFVRASIKGTPSLSTLSVKVLLN